MTDAADTADATFAPSRCPECRSRSLLRVWGPGTGHYACLGCGAHWDADDEPAAMAEPEAAP